MIWHALCIKKHKSVDSSFYKEEITMLLQFMCNFRPYIEGYENRKEKNN